MKASIAGVVAVGGAIGSVVRYGVSTIQSPTVVFPYAIFIVNLSGGFLMGIVTALLALKFNVSSEVRAFFTTGILGGYTTFSTFSLESAMLIERHDYGTAASYVIGSAVLSIVALFCGLWLVRVIYA
ncbi:MAG TPA: fluoride efflux transporter CrcB [Rhizomicrobium sp.]|jgi:CrcB protein